MEPTSCFAIVAVLTKMVFLGKISPEKRAYIAYLSQDKDFKVKDICKKTGISRATVHRIKQDKNCLGKRKKAINKGGRPRKLSARDERNIIRAVKKLRRTRGNYSTREIMSTSGIDPSEISERTVRRYLNKNGYFSLQSRKKGLLSEADCKRRLKFAREMKRNYSPEVWKDDIAFYLDGVSFTYKRRPKEQALAPRGRVWRKKSEGLARGCTAKGKKEGTGGKLVKVIVAISYNHGVIEVYEYEHLDGPFFANFVKERFPVMFPKVAKSSRIFLQDNAPNQNSACVRGALRRVKAKQLEFPPRSGDLNPIENVFKNAKALLHKQAINENIQYETYDEFKWRVINTLKAFSVTQIDKTIASMNKRIDMVIQKKGDRTKY